MQIVLSPTFYGLLLWLSPVALPSTPATPLIEILLNGVGPSDSFQCAQMLDVRFKRGDVPLETFIALDDYQSVGKLREATESYIQTSRAWKEVRDWVYKLH
jgi:hypothetical protein